MPLVIPEYGVGFSDGKPARDCEFPECPRRKRGYDGHKMRVCSKCKYVRYCGTDCQRSHWRVHKLTCRVPGLDNPHAWMNKYRGFSRWAAMQALHLHSEHSPFRENDITIQILILHGKQALGDDTPSDFRVLHVVGLAPIDPVLGRMMSDSADRRILAAGGLGALTVPVQFTNKLQAGGLMKTMPMVLEFPEKRNPGYQYAPYELWEKMYVAACNGMVSLDNLEVMAMQKTWGNAREEFLEEIRKFRVAEGVERKPERVSRGPVSIVTITRGQEEVPQSENETLD